MWNTMKLLVLGFVFVSLLACSNPAMVPVPLEKRTKSTHFDGEWSGKIAMDNKYQRHGRYEFTCSLWRADLSVTVKTGLVYGKVVYGNGEIQVFTTNLSDRGYFLGIMESGASRKIQYALRMSLYTEYKQGRGEFVLSNGPNGQGCTATADVELKS